MRRSLFIGAIQDRTFSYTVDRARECGFPFETIFLDRFYQRGVLRIDASGDGHVEIDEAVTDFDRYESVFVRLVPPSDSLDGACSVRPQLSRYRALRAFLQSRSQLVINPPNQDGGNSSKPFQNWFLATFGFAVAPTLATSSPQLAEAFIELHAGDVIYKTMSSVKSKATKITPKKLALLHRLADCPVMFQKRITGADVRLHVIGAYNFAECIMARDVSDYRFTDPQAIKLSAINAPKELLERCRTFMRYCRLPFVGFDFKIDSKSGEWVMLEANPAPGYEGYDRRANGLISQALFDVLADPNQQRDYCGWPVKAVSCQTGEPRSHVSGLVTKYVVS